MNTQETEMKSLLLNSNISAQGNPTITHFLPNFFDFVQVFVEDVLADELGPLELLSTERTEVLVLRELLRVHFNEPLSFSGGPSRRG